MHKKLTSFFMAVVVIATSLIFTQIYAPTRFKPLTSHLLDYPSTLPAIHFEKGIYRSTVHTTSNSNPLINQTKLKILSYLPQTPQIAKVWVWGEAKEERESKQAKGGYAAQIAGNQAAAEAVYQQNLAAAKPTTTPIVPTTAPVVVPNAGCTQSDAYCAQYGNEVGRYGYVDPVTGAVSGQYLVADGTPRDLAIAATLEASRKNVQVVTNQIGGLTEEGLLKITGAKNTTDALKLYLDSQSVIDTTSRDNISKTYLDNQKAKDYLNLSDEEINSKYGDNTTRYDLISSLPSEIKTSVQDQRNLGLQNQQKANLYLDSSKTNLELAQQVCGYDMGCVKEFKRENVLAGIDQNSDYYKSILKQATQNTAISNYLNKTNLELVKENCAGTSPDRCQDLIDGGLLRAVGLSDADAKSLVTQKQAVAVITKYETGTLTPPKVTYQSEYDKAYKACSPDGHADQYCGQIAAAKAGGAVANAKYTNDPIYVRSNEATLLTSSCDKLGGANCSDSIKALDSLATLTGNTNLNASLIQSQKIAYQQDAKAYSNIAGTLTTMGRYDDIAAAVAAGNTTWSQAETAIKNQRQDPLTNIVLGWNNFTTGRFKRGNDLLLEGYAQNDIVKSIQGGLIQGGDAAMVITAAAAIPLTPALGLGAGAYFGTAVGIAGTAQMTGSAADACTNGTEEACHTAIAMAVISGAGTGIGVLGQAATAVRAGTEVSALTRAVGTAANSVAGLTKAAEISVDALGAITFSSMAREACGVEGASTLDCASAVVMAAASSGKLIGNVGGSIAQLANIEKSTANIAQAGSKVMQSVHTVSADLFTVSACSKLGAGINSDSLSMCAMGLSGSGQAHAEIIVGIGKEVAKSTEKVVVQAEKVVVAPAEKQTINAGTNERIATPAELAALTKLEQSTAAREALLNGPAEVLSFQSNIERMNQEPIVEKPVLREESVNAVLTDITTAKAESSKILSELGIGGQKPELEKLGLAHDKLVEARELSRLKTLPEENRTVEQKNRFIELNKNKELKNIDQLVREYNQTLDEVRTSVLIDKQNGYKRLNEIQDGLQQVDVLTEISAIEQKLGIEKAKGSSADPNVISSLERDFAALTNKQEIVIPQNILSEEATLRLTDIVRDTEHRLAIFEDGVRTSRANQIDTLQKLVSGNKQAVELTTSGGKTMVGAMALKARMELIGNETGVYVSKEGAQNSIRNQIDQMTASGEKVIVLDVNRLGEPGYASEVLSSKYIVLGPKDITFLTNNTLDFAHPNRADSQRILDKMTENVATYYDEAQETLDPNTVGSNQKGEKTRASAVKDQAIADVARDLRDLSILVPHDNFAHQTWGSQGALEPRFLSPDGVALDTARFNGEAKEAIFAKLRTQNPEGGEFFDQIVANQHETVEKLMEITGVKEPAAVDLVLEQLSAVNTFAMSLNAEYLWSVDNVLAAQGEARYQKEVSIPKNGAASEGQTFAGDMNLTMEHVGAIRNGQTPDTAGLSTTSSKAIKSTIIDYVRAVSADPRNGQMAVTGTLGGARGLAESTLGFRIHANSDATTKAVGEAGSTNGRLINSDNGHVAANVRDGLQLITDGIATGKLDGSLKLGFSLGNMDGLEPARAVAEGLKQAGKPPHTYFIQEGGKRYFEVTLDVNGNVTSKTLTTIERIQQRFQNGEPNLIAIIDKGGSTGDSIKTPENIQFVPIFVEGDPTYTVAQLSGRGNRGNTVDMDTFAIIIGGTKEALPMGVTAESRIRLSNDNFDFKTWRANMEAQEIIVNKNNSTNINNSMVEAQGRGPIVDLIKEAFKKGDTKTAQWASEQLIDVFFTTKEGRNLSTADAAQLTIEKRNELARDASNKMKEILDKADPNLLAEISRIYPEIYENMRANRDFFTNYPNGYEYAALGPVESLSGRETFLLANTLEAGAKAHKRTITEALESKYVATTEKPKIEVVNRTEIDPSKPVRPSTKLPSLELVAGYSLKPGSTFSPIRWLGDVTGLNPTTKALKQLKIDLANGLLPTQTDTLSRILVIPGLSQTQQIQILTGPLVSALPTGTDLDGNISPSITPTSAVAELGQSTIMSPFLDAALSIIRPITAIQVGPTLPEVSTSLNGESITDVISGPNFESIAFTDTEYNTTSFYTFEGNIYVQNNEGEPVQLENTTAVEEYLPAEGTIFDITLNKRPIPLETYKITEIGQSQVEDKNSKPNKKPFFSLFNMPALRNIDLSTGKYSALTYIESLLSSNNTWNRINSIISSLRSHKINVETASAQMSKLAIHPGIKKAFIAELEIYRPVTNTPITVPANTSPIIVPVITKPITTTLLTHEVTDLGEGTQSELISISPSRILKTTTDNSGLRYLDIGFFVVDGNVYIANQSASPVVISINGETNYLLAGRKLDINPGDIISYGYLTLKYVGVENQEGKWIIKALVDEVENPPLNPETEFAEIAATPFMTDPTTFTIPTLPIERRPEIAEFVSKLSNHAKEIATLEGNLVSLINNNPDISEQELITAGFREGVTARLTDTQIKNLNKALLQYQKNRAKSSELYEKYKNKPRELFKATFGVYPIGDITLRKSRMTISFITEDIRDFAFVSTTQTGDTIISPTSLTKDQISRAERSGAFHLRSWTTLVTDSSTSIFNMVRSDQGAAIASQILHEDQHAIHNLLITAIAPSLNSEQEENSLVMARNSIHKIFANLSEKPSDIEYLKPLLNHYFYLNRKNAEASLTDELFAVLTEKYQQYGRDATKLVQNPSFIVTDLNRENEIEKYLANPNYSFFANMQSSALSSIEESIEQTLDKDQKAIFEAAAEEIFSAKAQRLTVRHALAAYKKIILKGYSHDDAVTLLYTTRMSNWGALARRVPPKSEVYSVINNIIKYDPVISATNIGKNVAIKLLKQGPAPTPNVDTWIDYMSRLVADAPQLDYRSLIYRLDRLKILGVDIPAVDQTALEEAITSTEESVRYGQYAEVTTPSSAPASPSQTQAPNNTKSFLRMAYEWIMKNIPESGQINVPVWLFVNPNITRSDIIINIADIYDSPTLSEQIIASSNLEEFRSEERIKDIVGIISKNAVLNEQLAAYEIKRTLSLEILDYLYRSTINKIAIEQPTEATKPKSYIASFFTKIFNPKYADIIEEETVIPNTPENSTEIMINSDENQILTLANGQTVKVIQKIGSGGFGKTFIVQVESTQKLLVLKVAHPDTYSRKVTEDEYSYLDKIHSKLNGVNIQSNNLAKPHSMLIGKNGVFRGYTLELEGVNYPGTQIIAIKSLKENLKNNERLTNSQYQQLFNFASTLDKYGFYLRDIFLGNILFNNDGSPVFIDPLAPSIVNERLSENPDAKIGHRDSKTGKIIFEAPLNSTNIQMLQSLFRAYPELVPENISTQVVSTAKQQASLREITSSTLISCSFCSVRIPEALKGIAATIADQVKESLVYNNDHTFTHHFIQSTLNVALYDRLGDLTGERSYYDKAIRYLTRIPRELNSIKDEIVVGTEVIEPSDLSSLGGATRSLVETIPVSGTPRAGNIAEFESNVPTAQAYLEGKRDGATYSPLTRFITDPLFSLRLTLNRFYGDLTGRGETTSPATPTSSISTNAGRNFGQMLRNIGQWISSRLNSPLLDQWSTSTKGQLTSSQQIDIISRISAEPNGLELQSTLIKSTAGIGNIFSNSTIPNDKKVETYVKLIKLTQILSQTNSRLNIRILITHLAANISYLDLDKLLTSTELLTNLSNSIKDPRNTVAVLVAISQSKDEIAQLLPDLTTIITDLSQYKISAEEVLTLIGEPLTIENVELVYKNLAIIELIAHEALNHLPLSQAVITSSALMTSLHTTLNIDDPSIRLTNIYNNLDKLISLSKKYKNGNKYDYQSDFVAAGIQSPDIYQFFSVITSPTFIRNKDHILDEFHYINSNAQKKGRLLLVPTLVFIGTIQDHSQILPVVKKIKIIARIAKDNAIESTTALVSFSQILSISNPDNITDITNLFETINFRFGSQAWIQHVINIYKNLDNNSQVIALIKDISILEQREIVLGLAAENPNNGQKLVNAINDLIFKHQASIASLVEAKEGYPGLRQSEIIRLAQGLNNIDSAFSESWDHVSSQSLIQDLLLRPGSLPLIEHIAQNHRLYLTVFNKNDDVNVRNKTITQLINSEDTESGIVNFRANQLKAAMANNTFTTNTPIPTDLNSQDSYILSSALNAYPTNNSYVEDKSLENKIEETLRHFFPNNNDEYILRMSKFAMLDSRYLVYLINFRQELSTIYSNPNYDVALAEGFIRQIFDMATANQYSIWNDDTARNLITQISQYLDSPLPKILTQLVSFQRDLFAYLIKGDFPVLLPKAITLYNEGYISHNEHNIITQGAIFSIIKNFQIPEGDNPQELKIAFLTEFIADNIDIKFAVDYIMIHTGGKIESLLPYFTGYHRSFWTTYLVYPTFGHFVANQNYGGMTAWKYFKEKIGSDRSPDQVKILMLTLARNSKDKDVIWAQFRQRSNKLDKYLETNDSLAPHSFLTPELRAFWNAYENNTFLRYRLNSADGYDYYIKHLYKLPDADQLYRAFVIEQTIAGNTFILWDNASNVIKALVLDSLNSGLPDNIRIFWEAYISAEYFSSRDFLTKNIDKINTYWQPNKFSGTFTPQFYIDFAQADPNEFVIRFTRKELALAIGENATQALLKSLPSGQTDEARNAFTHNEYDRTTDFFVSLITNPISHFAFTPQNMEIVTAYITQFGLSKTPMLFNYYQQLYLFEKGELKELSQDLVDSKITSLSNLQARFETTKAQLFSDTPITKLDNLSQVEIEIISLLTNHSIHRWTVNPISDIVSSYTKDLASGAVVTSTPHYSTATSIPLVNYENNDFSSSADSYKQMTEEILASLDNPEDITSLKDQLLSAVDEKSSELKQALDTKNTTISIIEKLLAEFSGSQDSEVISQLINLLPEENTKKELVKIQNYILTDKYKVEILSAQKTKSEKEVTYVASQIPTIKTLRTKVLDSKDIDQLVGILVQQNISQFGTGEQTIRSIFRQLALKKLFTYRQRSPEWVEEVRNHLTQPISIQSLSEVINIIDNRIKDHVLNVQKKNTDQYWTDETYNLLTTNKKRNNINDYFLSHLNPLRETLASLKMSETEKNLSIEMIPDKGIVGEMSGYCGGVCYTKVFPLLSTYPNLTPYKFVTTDPITGNKELIGSALVFEIETTNGEKAYVIRAFDIRDEASMDIGAFFEKFADHLAAIGQTNGISKVLVAGTGGTVSNYPITTQYVLGKYVNGKTNTSLKEKFNFNDYDITNYIFEVRSNNPISIPDLFRIGHDSIQPLLQRNQDSILPSPLLPMLALPAAMGGGTTIGTVIINAAYNAAVAVIAPLAPYIGSLFPYLSDYGFNQTLIYNAKLWVDTLYPSLSNFSLSTWIDSIIPQNFTFIPFGMSVVTPPSPNLNTTQVNETYINIISDSNGNQLFGIKKDAITKYGTNGKVIQGVDLKTRAKVAIKQQLSASDPGFDGQSQQYYEEYIINEGNILSRLDHPNIPKLLHRGQDSNNVAILVTPWIDGASLDSTLQTQPLSFQDTTNRLANIAEALDYAHAHGIAHKDVLGLNIMDDTLIDWGKGLIKEEDTYLPTFDASISLDMRKFAAIIYHAITGEKTAGNAYVTYAQPSTFENIKTKLTQEQRKELDAYFEEIFSETKRYTSTVTMIKDFMNITSSDVDRESSRYPQ